MQIYAVTLYCGWCAFQTPPAANAATRTPKATWGAAASRRAEKPRSRGATKIQTPRTLLTHSGPLLRTQQAESGDDREQGADDPRVPGRRLCVRIGHHPRRHEQQHREDQVHRIREAPLERLLKAFYGLSPPFWLKEVGYVVLSARRRSALLTAGRTLPTEETTGTESFEGRFLCDAPERRATRPPGGFSGGCRSRHRGRSRKCASGRPVEWTQRRSKVVNVRRAAAASRGRPFRGP